MHDWLGMALIALGIGLLAAGVMKRRSRLRIVLPQGAIRPEFAAIGEMVRPMIMLFVGYFALKMSLFYFLLGGQRFLSPLDYAGIMFVLAAYIGWLQLATKRPAVAPAASVTASPAPLSVPAAAMPADARSATLSAHELA